MLYSAADSGNGTQRLEQLPFPRQGDPGEPGGRRAVHKAPRRTQHNTVTRTRCSFFSRSVHGHGHGQGGRPVSSLLVFGFGFSFLEGSCWLAENRMHAHFQLHKACLDRVWRTESKRKKQCAVCFFLPKVCSKKIKKSLFFVRVSVMLCGGKPSRNSDGERAFEGNVRFFRICETESGRTGVCDIIETRGVLIRGSRAPKVLRHKGRTFLTT